jgi:hypothetical protein
LNVITNSPKQRWRWLMVEISTLNSLATALVDIPAVSYVALYFVTTAHLRVAFYCPRHTVHLCNDHAVLSASWYATPVRWVDYFVKGEMLSSRDINKFVHIIWKKLAFCAYGHFLGSFISAHETWDKHFTCFVYMCSFVMQHNATDVPSFEGACSWHADCRNVHQICCQRTSFSFLFHKLSPMLFLRIW